MTEGGSYRSMDFGELFAAFGHLSPEAQFFRPAVAVGDEPDRVYQAFVGPTDVSTCVGLVPAASLPIWDVNGYYRAIGVEWPYRPSRGQMRRGYQRVGGPTNDYATYAFKRLLDPEFRARYDRRPLGAPMDDVYRWAEVRRMAADWAAKQSAITGRAVTVEDILGEDLVARMNAQAEAERQADEVATKRIEREAESDALHEPEQRPEPQDLPFVWPYAYYLWNSAKLDDERLFRWHEMVIRSCAAQGLSFHLAFGYCRTPGDVARYWYRKPDGGGVEIVFLHENTEPTQELADVVVATYHTHGYGQLVRPIHLHDPAR